MIGRRDPMRDDLTALDELERDVHRPVRRPASLIVPILIMMIVMTGGVTIAWYSYNAGVKEGSEGSAPLLKPAGPMKVAPDSPGGAKIPHQEMTVYQSLNDISEQNPVERILPPPERPMTPPAPAAAPAAAPATAGPGENSRVRSADTVPDGPAPAATPGVSAPIGQPVPAGQSARSLVPPPTIPAPSKELQPAFRQPKSAGAPPAEVRAADAKPGDKPARAEPAPQVASIPTGAYRIQLGSVSTEGQATGFWAAQRDKNGDLLGQLALNVEKATISGKTYYRIQAGPLKDSASARTLCDQLKRRQIGCIIVNPKN